MAANLGDADAAGSQTRGGQHAARCHTHAHTGVQAGTGSQEAHRYALINEQSLGNVLHANPPFLQVSADPPSPRQPGFTRLHLWFFLSVSILARLAGRFRGATAFAARHAGRLCRRRPVCLHDPLAGPDPQRRRGSGRDCSRRNRDGCSPAAARRVTLPPFTPEGPPSRRPS